MLNFGMILLLTVLGSYGSYCIKTAVNKSSKFLKVFFQPALYIGGILYLASIGLYILALKQFNLSILSPLTSITYVWSMIFSFYFLKEKITRLKVAGAFLIVLGSVVLIIPSWIP